MKQISMSVNPAVKAEKPMRSILGINNLPIITYKPNYDKPRAWFDEMKFRHIRHHDAALDNPGMQLLDVGRIFPLFHLDENDARNYYFKQSDDYVALLQGRDAEIDYRLGECIDHSGYGRMVQAPENAEKWARICRNIIAHYKDGAMDGMHLNIKRVTVWEEPDNGVLFGGTVEQYAALYCAVWKLFKKEWPELQVGGPTMCGGRYPFFDRFLAICKENGVTPDYATVTQYQRSLDTMPETVRTMRAMLDEYGFTATKIVIAEWHLGPLKWGPTQGRSDNGFETSISAAFGASSLIRLMDIDYLDAAFFYAWGNKMWSVYNVVDSVQYRRPVYFGLKYFNQLAADCGERLAVEWEGGEDIEVLAGRTEDGKVRLLVSCYESATTAFSCKVEGAVSCTMKSVRSAYNEADAAEGKALEVNADGGVMFGQDKAGSDVFLLEFSF